MTLYVPRPRLISKLAAQWLARVSDFRLCSAFDRHGKTRGHAALAFSLMTLVAANAIANDNAVSNRLETTAAELQVAIQTEEDSEALLQLLEKHTDVQRLLLQLATDNHHSADELKKRRETLISALESLSDHQLSLDHFESAKKLRYEILAVTKAALEDTHWRVKDARLAIQHVEQLGILSQDQRDELKGSSELVKQYIELRKMKRYQDAIGLAEKCGEIRKRILGEQHPDFATSLSSIAGLYFSAKQYTKSMELFEQSLDIRRRVLGASHPRTIDSTVSLATRNLAIGRYDAAEPLYREALREIDEHHPERLKTLRSIALGLNRIANISMLEGEYAQAEKSFETVIDILSQIVGKTNSDYALSCQNLATLYRHIGEFGKAESLFLQARDALLATVGEDHPHYASTINGLGLVYERMGEYAKAEPLLVKARDIRLKWLGDEDLSYGESLNNLGLLYHRMKRYEKAETAFLKAAEICRNEVGKEHPDYATSLSNLALLYLDMERYDESEKLYKEALQIRSRLGKDHVLVGDTKDQLAKLYRLQGNLAEAVRLHQEACDIYRRTFGENHPKYAWSLHRLGTTQLLMNQPQKAKSSWENALRIKLKIADQTLPWLPEAQALSFLKTLTTDDSSGGRDPLLCAYRHFPVRSEVDVRNVYDAVWQTRGLVLRTLVARRGQLAESNEAKQVLLRLRSVQQSLAQLMLAPPVDDRQRAARQQRLVTLNADKEKLERELAQLSSAFRQDQIVQQATPADLAKRLPNDTALVDFIRVNVWKATSDGRNIPEKTPFYEAFVLRPGKSNGPYSVEWTTLGPAVEIDELIGSWRLQIQRMQNFARGRRLGISKPKPDDHARQALRQLIWDKLDSQLSGCKNVVILPDGDLHRLPWAALPGRSKDSYLLEDFGLATAASGQQVFSLLSRDAPPEGRALLVGGVDYDRVEVNSSEQPTVPTSTPALPRTRANSWNYLPGTLAEVNALKSLWPDAAKLTFLTDAGAQEEKLRSEIPQSRYVHFATHGFFADARFRSMYGLEEDSSPAPSKDDADELVTASQGSIVRRNPLLLSGLLFSGANLAQDTDKDGLPKAGHFDDGRLTAEEFVNLDLRNTDLVVLSACETGLGTVGGGEGVFGLQRAFQLAGARTTIATLWQVDDDATKALMIEFYKNLWQKKMSKLDSLRQAQLMVLKKYDTQSGQLAVTNSSEPAAPYYWAAFTLSGDWR